MARVDFYILDDGDAARFARFVCRLTEKAFTGGLRVYIRAPIADEQRRLDDMLWTFRQGSFVPHALAGTSPINAEPVLIGETPAFDQNYDVVVNLADSIPAHYERFNRIAEVVRADVSSKETARHRFRVYRDAGLEIFSHKVESERA